MPVHNEAANIPVLVQRIQSAVAQIPTWEVRILLIDDGSTDQSVAVIQQMRDKGMFLDLTPTSYGGFFMKILEPSIVMSPAFRSARVTSATLCPLPRVMAKLRAVIDELQL